MTKSEKNIITAINTETSNDLVTVKKGGLFLDKDGISQNFAVIVKDHLIIRIDHNCKGIYKKIIKNIDKIDKPFILGTDTVSKFMINGFTEIDAEEMLENIFQYCDIKLINFFKESGLSLKSAIYNTAQFFDLGNHYFDIINEESSFRQLRSHFSTYFNYITMTSYIPDGITEEYNQIEWLSHYRGIERNSIISGILGED